MAAEYFLAAPPGFLRSHEVLSSLPGAVLSRLAEEIALHQEGRQARPAAEALVRLCAAEDPAAPPLPLDDARCAVRGADYCLTGARVHKLGGDELRRALAAHTELSGDAAEALAAAADASRGKKTDAATALHLGRLVGMDWKLGVGVRSSHCEALRTPFVSIVLRVADTSGRVQFHPLELGLKEFGEFSRNFKQIAKQLGV